MQPACAISKITRRCAAAHRIGAGAILWHALRVALVDASPRSGNQARNVPLQGKDEAEFDVTRTFRILPLRHRVPDAAGGAAEFRQHALKRPRFCLTDTFAKSFVTPRECLSPGLRLAQRRIIPGPLPLNLADLS
jgi:hypothetical protein